jgi:hypothetical protein
LHVEEAAGSRAIFGRLSGSGTALYGQADSFLSQGVFGTSAGLLSKGVEGTASGTSGYGVRGNATGSGSYGVFGNASGADSFGVYGNNTGTGNSGYGVYGNVRVAVTAFGLLGDAASTNGSAYGLRGLAHTDSAVADSFGVYGQATGAVPTTGKRYGVFGKASPGANSWAVFADGDSGGTGLKHFVQPHPSDPSRVVQFVCLEGNESGTYFRGTGRVVNGRAEIAIPEEWRLVTAESGITVQLTPIASFARLSVFEKSRDRIVVGGTDDCEFDYLVNGVRRGYTEYEPFADNAYFRPTVRGIAYGGQYPAALREILVENGILNADFTPNEQTAARLGWTLTDSMDVPAEQRFWLAPAERDRAVAERAAARVERAEGR